MNYFDFHIGDYMAATAHLSMLEDAVYHRLMCLYYRTESAIPADVTQAARLVRAQTKAERAAVQQVLLEFFELQEDGWHNSRCDAEIEAYRATEPEREAKKANESNRLRLHREERSRLFKALTDAGQHAPWNCPMGELRALVAALPKTHGAPDAATQAGEPATAPETPVPPTPATAPETPATATHLPPPTSHRNTGIQARATSTVAARAEEPPPGVSGHAPTPAGALCRRLRDAGLADVNPAHPVLLALLQAGASEAEFMALVPKALGKRTPFVWLLGAVEGQRSDAAKTAGAVHRGPMRAVNRQEAVEAENRRVAAEWAQQMRTQAQRHPNEQEDPNHA